MGPKKQISFQGRMVPAQEIEFESRTPEAWSSYALKDGTTLKVKIVLLNVFRLDEYDPNGQPIYQFTAQQIVAVQAPDELRKKSN